MNKAIIIGNLTADPEVRTTNGGASVCNFTVAVRRNFRNQQGEYDSDFLPVQAWKASADYCGKYLKKGSRVAVEGAIQTRSYDKDGVKRYVTEIIAANIESLTPRQSGDAPRADTAAAQRAADALFTEVQDDQPPY